MRRTNNGPPRCNDCDRTPDRCPCDLTDPRWWQLITRYHFVTDSPVIIHHATHRPVDRLRWWRPIAFAIARCSGAKYKAWNIWVYFRWTTTSWCFGWYPWGL